VDPFFVVILQPQFLFVLKLVKSISIQLGFSLDILQSVCRKRTVKTGLRHLS